MHHRLAGTIVWGVILGALVLWELVGLHWNDRVPTFTQVVLFFGQPRVGRWALFGLWIWIGFHFWSQLR